MSSKPPKPAQEPPLPNPDDVLRRMLSTPPKQHTKPSQRQGDAMISASSNIATIIAPDQFDKFATLLKEDTEFPKTYAEWLERATNCEKKILTRGETINHVKINAQEFSDYCRSCGHNPNLYWLNAFTVAKSRGK